MNTERLPSTKREFAYRALRGHLLGGTLLPGDRLREIPLAQQLGVSRIPLREAIDQLASEGLVERVPGLGRYVRFVTPTELRELYEMREVLEGFTVEKACTTISREQLGRLEDLCHQISSALAQYRHTGTWSRALRDQLVGADVAFHQTIASAAGNESIRREIERLQAVAEVVSYRPEFAQDETEAMTRAAAEHHAILAAVRRRDGPRARSLMARHITRAGGRALLVVEAAVRSAEGARRPTRPG
jgi:DNA-binding GntR family transcriptional regulator